MAKKIIGTKIDPQKRQKKLKTTTIMFFDFSNFDKLFQDAFENHNTYFTIYSIDHNKKLNDFFSKHPFLKEKRNYTSTDIDNLKKRLETVKNNDNYEFAALLRDTIRMAETIDAKIKEAIKGENWAAAAQEQHRFNKIFLELEDGIQKTKEIDVLLKQKEKYIEQRNFEKVLEIEKQIKNLK